MTITFGRNMKGQTSFPRLSLAGMIISEGDGTGKDCNGVMYKL